jgi:hypothetical protein
VRVWGNQDNVRANLVALPLAVQIVPKIKSVVISTRYEHAIRYYGCATRDVRLGAKSILGRAPRAGAEDGRQRDCAVSRPLNC